MTKQFHLLVSAARALIAAALALSAPLAFAHDHGHAMANKTAAPISTDEHPFGRGADPKRATRTITVTMDDNMRFSPSEITVKQGDIVTFVIKNKGMLNHEMVLGTLDDLKSHGELMKKNAEMAHDEPYMAHVKPGGQQQMVWQFTKAGVFNYGCLALGHLDAGMLGRIKVAKR
jgi:uncharacterized cupredoxin-like copper-binding protein